MLAFNVAEFHAISAKCKGQNSKHKHAKWGYNRSTSTFATSEETAYPMGLAKMIAMVIIRALVRMGIQANPETLEGIQPTSIQALQKMRASVGIQPRASCIPALVPTFQSKFSVLGDEADLPAVNIFQRIKDDVVLCKQPLQILPKGAKLLAITPPENQTTGEREGQLDLFKLNANGKKGNAEHHKSGVVQTWGIPWKPESFVQEVVRAGHPMDMMTFLPKRLQELLSRYGQTSAEERSQKRISTLKFWLKRALEVKKQEAELHQGLSPEVAQVLKGKRVVVWRQMLESINYEDMGVVEEFTTGTPLLGESPPTGLWPRKFKPATMTEEDLATVATSQRSALTYSSFEFMEAGVIQSVWEQTLEEVRAGELLGPFELEDIPVHQPLSKRFGIQQSSKVRCVDDFTQSSINACTQTCESPKPHTVDVIGSMCLALMNMEQTGEPWQARSFDLKRAYRQCAIRPDHGRYSCIAVADPTSRKVRCFKMKALPFGSVMSVHAFLRVAHSLWAILVSVFDVFISNYFDDFVALAMESETGSVTTVTTSAFKLLGWAFAETGAKAPPFSQVVAALGVLIDVSGLHVGCVKIDNTANRKAEISAVLDSVLQTGLLPRQEALKLRGRLQFMSGQIFGRIAKRTLAIVTQHAYGENGPRVSEDAKGALRLFRQLLSMDVPREISAAGASTHFVFTDACYEPQQESQKAGIGAVLVDLQGRMRSFISLFLPDEFLEKLNLTQKKTIIFECELLAIFIAMKCWSNVLTDSQVVVCTDNEGVKDALISCQTSSANATPILFALLQLEFDLRWNAWFSRVPTESNIADMPSRGEFQHLVDAGASRVHVVLEGMWDEVLSLSTRGGTDQHFVPHASEKVLQCEAS